MTKEILLKALRKIGEVLLCYFLYVLISAFILPILISPPERVERPLAFAETSERVTLLEYGLESNAARINSIEQAQESIDVAYYYMDEGESVDQFYAYILAAANRGVKVRYLLDGIAHGVRGEYRDVFHLFNLHPNIEFKLHEPVTKFAFAPWRINNRLHDKLLLIDNSYAIIGGRNIGDIYFQRNHSTEPYSFDRDILLFNEEQETDGLVRQMNTYFDSLWETEFTVDQGRIMMPWERKTARTIKAELEDLHTFYEEEIQKRTHTSTIDDWLNRSVAIERGLFTHNSLERLYKQPYVWSDLLTLASEAENDLLIQTPWLTPNRRMRKDIQEANITVRGGRLLTNGKSTTSNMIGQSGTENRKQAFIESAIDYYEFQPTNSALHTKTLVADQKFSAIGTFNFDARSSYLSTESMVIIESSELAEQILKETEETYLEKSVLYEADGTMHAGENTNGEAPTFWRRLSITLFRPLAWLAENLI